MILSPSPHLHTPRTVRGTMFRVLLALTPAWITGLWVFGFPVVWLTAVCIASCMLAEWLITRYMLRRPDSLGDLSAVVTGLLLAMNLPPTLPLWMAVAGSVAAIGIAKMCFGGLGANIFNPALVGRVFLLISFPAAMTEWLLPDGTVGATVLSGLKENPETLANLEPGSMFLGIMGGSAGETGSLALLLGGLYLIADKVIRWEIPAAILAAVVVLDLCLGFPPVIDLLSGGLLLGAFFMATDYTTSPMTRRGMLVYGTAIGLLTVCIRRWGAYPEGMSFAILIMNGFTPLINRYILPRRFSPKAAKEGAKA